MKYSGVVFSGLFLVACGDSIDGDWQFCVNSACTTHGEEGLRFRDDKTFVVVDTEDLCESQSDRGNGTYEFEDDRLSIYPFNGDYDSVRATIDGERLILELGRERILMSRTEFGELSECTDAKDDQPPLTVKPAPSGEPGSTSSGGGGT